MTTRLQAVPHPGHPLKILLGAGCAYELAALASRHRIPTITDLCRRHRAAEMLLLGILVVHLHRKEAS